MKKLHLRLLDEVRKRHPTFAPKPESAERITATEKWLGAPLEAREEGNAEVVEHLEGEEAFFRREAEELEEREAERKSKPRTNDLSIQMVTLEERRLLVLEDDKGDRVYPFASWLSSAIDQAIADETTPLPPVSVPEPDTEDETMLRRALDLVDRLVAGQHLAKATDFDDEACARALLPVFGDAERMLDVLVDLPSVDEVFLSEDELESILSLLGADD